MALCCFPNDSLILYLFYKHHRYSGAKVDAKTATGDTALTYACENGHTNVAEVLLDLGAELVCFC